MVSTLSYLAYENAVYPHELADDYEEEEGEMTKEDEVVESQNQEAEGEAVMTIESKDPELSEQAARSSAARSSGGSNQMETVA